MNLHKRIHEIESRAGIDIAAVTRTVGDIRRAQLNQNKEARRGQ